ncbi:MAG: SDR family oxidoreductase [Cyanobacteria bacterium J06626_18]
MSGKTVLITGGSSGIGKGAAKAIVTQGGRVAITGRNNAKLQAAATEIGPEAQVLTVLADVSQLSEINHMVKCVGDRYGQIDGLFANAGFGRFQAARDIDGDAFDSVFAVNVKGVFFTIQRTLSLLKRPAAIVINASWTSHRGLPIGTPYAATKAAVRSFVRTLTSELGQDGLRINSISPGLIDTPAIADMSDSERVFWQSQIPLGRLGTAVDVGKVVAFLLSDDAAYIAGEDILIDGGFTKTVAMPPQ